MFLPVNKAKTQQLLYNSTSDLHINLNPSVSGSHSFMF